MACLFTSPRSPEDRKSSSDDFEVWVLGENAASTALVVSSTTNSSTRKPPQLLLLISLKECAFPKHHFEGRCFDVDFLGVSHVLKRLHFDFTFQFLHFWPRLVTFLLRMMKMTDLGPISRLVVVER